MLVITHPGKFHLDEIVAISLLKLRFEREDGIPVHVERRMPTDAEMQSHEVWVVDIGGAYWPRLRNFDHHHDKSIPCSAVLVAKEILSAQSYELASEFLDAVDAADRGETDRGTAVGQKVTGLRHFAAMIQQNCLIVDSKKWEEELDRLFFIVEAFVREVVLGIITGDKAEIIRKEILAGPKEMWGPWTVLINEDPRVAFVKLMPSHSLFKETGIDFMVTKTNRGNWSLGKINPKMDLKELGLNKDTQIPYLGFWDNLEEIKSRL